ncbi:MAG: protein-glutamate O-methyltransferase CheR [Bacteroidales bacterium]|nr:protein-glutamate O-methyltransferase CheR [Bacteroidales bacterium]
METTNLEIRLLLEAIYMKYGYDFRNYGQAHLKRRILHRKNLEDFETIADMVKEVIYNQEFFDRLLLDLSINVTEMFRDPSFYQAIREKVIPQLRTYPFLKIWHAGCASGEEVYSMAILLEEEGLYDKVQLYATDFNQMILKKARQGIYPMDRIKQYTSNYQKSGGKNSFADYYSAKYDSVIINPSIKRNIVFADHNLVLDGVFGEMNMVICRNVLIYFNTDLQNHVIRLFLDSLTHGGFLALGSRESLRFTDYYEKFTEVSASEKIYKKQTIVPKSRISA